MPGDRNGGSLPAPRNVYRMRDPKTGPNRAAGMALATQLHYIRAGPPVGSARNGYRFTMPLTLICRAAAVAACLVFALPAWGNEHEAAPPTSAETADEAQAPDEAKAPDAADQAAGQADARALIAAGRFVEALNILGPLISANAVDANTVFLYGLAAAGAAQLPGMPDDTRENLLNEAIGAFRTMLIEEPGLLRVRLELARAFFLKGEEELARRHFELVLAADPPEAVVVNVRRFLAELQSRRRWSYRLGAALAPDSNIGGTSDERTIYIFNLPFERDVEELSTSGIGVSVWGGAEYHYPLAQDLRLRAGAEFARREYEQSHFDQLFVATHLGPRWLIDRSTELSVLGSARQRWIGTVPDDRELGGRLEVGHRVSEHVTVSGQASWHGRRYRTRSSLSTGRSSMPQCAPPGWSRPPCGSSSPAATGSSARRRSAGAPAPAGWGPASR